MTEIVPNVKGGIQSVWTWAGSRDEIRTLQILLITDGSKRHLRFIGGPTGYESYFLDDLLAGGIMDRSGDFYICAGCSNYPRCTVQYEDVQRFIVEATCYV